MVRTNNNTSVRRTVILAVIIIIAFILGRLTVRAVGCLLLGGTMFGGNIP